MIFLKLTTAALLAYSSVYLYNRMYVPESSLITLYTPWGERLDNSSVLPEYPRPQYVRNSYLNLNGVWDYALTDSMEFPTKYDGQIVVPFSIECPLSGVQKHLTKDLTLWYRREFDISKFKNNGRLILHFGAVDQNCEVFINNASVGTHDGGYTAFEFDITDKASEKIEIVVRVIDHLEDDGAAYGKQSEKRGGIWYSATGGIWQTVWLESVPNAYVEKVKITPLYDQGSVEFVPTIIDKEGMKNGKVTVFDAVGAYIAEGVLTNNQSTVIEIKNFKSWSPESPYLYKCVYEYGDDLIESYFAMRKFSTGKDEKGVPRLFLNNKPYFHNGLLDQGYWSDGYYTAPSDDAIKYDIQKMKSLGFNMLRKHIKIEPLRWYYHCDTIGMLVWQDAVSGGYPYHPMIIEYLPFIGIDYISDSHYSWFGRTSEIGRNNYYRDLKDMINHLYNVPSIALWVPFNEAWGQFDAVKAVSLIKELDKTRTIDHASGWHDQGDGDCRSLHVYFKKVNIKSDKHGRSVVLSEFGGYSYGIKDHVGSTAEFGYAKYKSKEELNDAIKKLYENEIIPQISKGLSATVYTQVSDVEDEVNGLLTYDRKICKADENVFREIMNKLKY